MQAEKKAKSYTKKIRNFLALIIILIFLMLFIIPAFISSKKGQRVILEKVNKLVDGQTNFADLSMGWIKGLNIKDISYTDTTGQTSVKIKQISTKPHYGSILFGNLSFGRTVIDKPTVEINLKTNINGKKQSPELKTFNASLSNNSQSVTLPIKKIDLVINDGKVKVTDKKSGSVLISQINSHIDLNPPGRKTNFDANLTVENKGKDSKVTASGRIKPNRRTGWTLEGTTGEMTIEVTDLNLASLSPFFALAGIDIQAKGDISVDIKTDIKDGQIKHASGSIKASDLDITGQDLKGDHIKTSALDIAVELKTEKHLIDIDKLEIHSDWANASISGIVPTTFESFSDLLKPDSKYDLNGQLDCDLAAILSQMPNTMGLKEGMKLNSGKIKASFKTITEAGKRKISGQANLADLKGYLRGKTIALSDPVNAQVQITSDKAGLIKYEKVSFSSAFCNIDASGTNELFKHQAQIDLQKLQSELGQFIDIGPYKIAGKFSEKGTISKEKKKINIIGDSIINDLRITSDQNITAFEPKANIDYSFTIEQKNEILSINYIKAVADFGQIATKDAVIPLSKKVQKNIKLPLKVKVDLAKLRPYAVLFASMPQDLQISGIAESQLMLTAKNDNYYFKTDATKIRNLKLLSPGQEPFEQSEVTAACDAEFNTVDKTFAISWQLLSPQIKIKGSLNKKTKDNQTKLQGKADCNYDWAALSSVASAFIPEGLIIQGKRTDVFKFSSQYPADQTDKLLANLNTTANIGFEKAQYMGLNFGQNDLNIQIQNGVLNIAPFTTTVNQGQLSFAANVDFKKQPAILKVPQPMEIAKDIQINDQTTEKLLKYVNPVFANAVNVSGKINFSCEKLAIPLSENAENKLEVIGTIAINNMQMQTSGLLGTILSMIGSSVEGKDITIHPTFFIFQNGILKYDDMQMDVGRNPINFKGIIGPNKKLDMRVTLPYTLDGKSVRIDDEPEILAQRMVVPLTGTVDNPELDMGKLMEEQLKQRLEQELRKGLEKIFR